MHAPAAKGSGGNDMTLRWLHESVTWKPWRPLTEWLLLIVGALIGCLGRWLKRRWQWFTSAPSPHPMNPQDIREIIVLRPDHLGDVILMTPMLVALQAWLPRAKITAVVSHTTSPLLTGHPAVDNVIAIRGDRLVDFWHSRCTLRTLRARPATCLLVCESSWPVALLAWWLRGTHRVGYDTQGRGFLFTVEVPDSSRRIKRHEVEANLRLAQAIGCPVDHASRQPTVVIPITAHTTAQQWVAAHQLSRERPIVMIHPGSRSRYTRWAPERFALVAEQFRQAIPAQLIVLCGRGERPLMTQILRRMSFHPIVAQGLSLTELGALMSLCALFVGNATGTAHLAAAVGTRVIMIIGGTHPLDCPERWRPVGEQHLIVHKSPREVLGRDTWNWLGPEGLAHIQPEEVVAAIRVQLTRVATA